MSLANSTLVKNLVDGGKLPEMEVSLSNKSTIELCIAVTITAIVLILSYKLIKKI